LNLASRLAGLLFFPFRNNVVVGPDAQKALEQERKGVGGRLYESKNLNVVIADAKIPAMAFEMRFRQVVVEKRVVFQFRLFKLEGIKIQRSLQNGECFLFSEDSHLDEVANMGAKILDFLGKDGFRARNLLGIEPHVCV